MESRMYLRLCSNAAVLESPEKQCGTIRVGKAPGQTVDVKASRATSLRTLFGKAKKANRAISDLRGCVLQVNGNNATMEDVAEPGDEVLAIPKIQGN